MAEFKRRKRRPKVKFKVEDINYKNVELLIHKEYDSVRVDGEWFRMDNNDICHIIKKYGFICVE